MSKQVFILLLTTIIYSCTIHKNSKNDYEYPESNENTKTDDNISKQKQLQGSLAFYYNGTLTELIEKAGQENKLVFIDFTADWCAPCNLWKKKYIHIHRYMNFIISILSITESMFRRKMDPI